MKAKKSKSRQKPNMQLAADINGLSLTAHKFAAAAPKKNITLFCLPGGGLSKDYFNLAPNFSFAARMSALGYDVITMDHPGVGDNALPAEHPFYTPREAAGYLSKALAQWDIKTPIIGIGHSLGGMMIMLMQGLHSPFTRLGLFGSSAGGLDWGLSEEEKAYINKPDEFAREIEVMSLAKFGCATIPAGKGPSGESITFGGQTPELNERLRAAASEMNAAGAMMSMMRGSFRPEAEAIEVPLFFAFGDHDIGNPPQDVPKDFPSASSTKTIILKSTGHNHFAFSSIGKLCKAFDVWVCQ